MAGHSQFLFFYIDELIKHHWVSWLEGPLATRPQDEHRVERGFQLAIGDTGAGPRTRAGEAYQLGILSGRIVRPRVAGASFPSGWQAVIDGHIPSTKLGYYSYVIGKALRESPLNANLERALDCLASILILHIGFQSNDRWFNTVLLFQYAYDQCSARIGRSLTNEEVRYLAAAVINTLDSDTRGIFLDRYISDLPIKSLQFDLNNGESLHFDLTKLPNIVADKEVGINDFQKTKAALFWANPTRGIYMRAVRSPGKRLIQEMVKADQQLAQIGEKNLLQEVFSSIQNNENNLGIFSIAELEFSKFPGLLREWQDLEAELFKATNKAAEAVDSSVAHPTWLLSQKTIRGSKSTQPIFDNENDELGDSEQRKEKSKNKILPLGQYSDLNRGQTKKTIKKIELPTQESLRQLIETELNEILEPPPKTSNISEGNPKKKKTQVVTQIDFATREARNRELGEAGEYFVYQYEIMSLIASGRLDLAKRVRWVSKDLGDGLGYDIQSFDRDGNEIFLEVKTTNSGQATPFFVSNNEVAVSEEKGPSYRLIRVFNFSEKPRLFCLIGSLSRTLQLEATSYRARL